MPGAASSSLCSGLTAAQMAQLAEGMQAQCQPNGREIHFGQSMKVAEGFAAKPASPASKGQVVTKHGDCPLTRTMSTGALSQEVLNGGVKPLARSNSVTCATAPASLMVFNTLNSSTRPAAGTSTSLRSPMGSPNVTVKSEIQPEEAEGPCEDEVPMEVSAPEQPNRCSRQRASLVLPIPSRCAGACRPLDAHGWPEEEINDTPPQLLPLSLAVPPGLPSRRATGSSRASGRLPPRLQQLDDQTVIPREVYNNMLQLGDKARGQLGYGQHRLVFVGPAGVPLLRQIAVMAA